MPDSIPTLDEVLDIHWYQQIGATCAGCEWRADRRAGAPEADWANHAAEAYREARTIRGEDVADGWVVRSASGTIAARFDRSRGVVLGCDRPFPWSALASPAEVLWTPRDGEPA
jgi:hypothetical protein